MNLCITRSNKNAYSETFIASQIAGLAKRANVYQIHTAWLPERDEHDRLLTSRLFWILHKVVKNIFSADNNYFGNYGIKKYLLKNKIEVVLSNYGVGGVKLLPICRSLHIPLIIHFHGFDATDFNTLKRYQDAYKKLFGYAAAIIAVSRDMQQQLIKLGAPPDKVYLNSYGVDTGKFSLTTPSSNGNIFVAVGRFTAKKAPHLTIQAFKKVHEAVPDAKLIMVGTGEPLLHECRELVRELGLSGAVNLAGQQSHREISQLLKYARAFVQHSVTAEDGDTEGTPVAILEAASSGLPVVATFHAGIKDAVIHGETGFLVEEGDVDGMAEYMIKLARDPRLADEMGKRGRKHIEDNYESDKQIEKLYNIISQHRPNSKE